VELRQTQHRSGVLLLEATNTPWVLDAAILRRFGKKLYIPLPDEGERVQFFELYFKNASHALEDKHLKTVAQQTEGYVYYSRIKYRQPNFKPQNRGGNNNRNPSHIPLRQMQIFQ
jgi:SpoVK/Ycf46/Vps4 family AAA+-type ATPase